MAAVRPAVEAMAHIVRDRYIAALVGAQCCLLSVTGRTRAKDGLAWPSCTGGGPRARAREVRRGGLQAGEGVAGRASALDDFADERVCLELLWSLLAAPMSTRSAAGKNNEFGRPRKFDAKTAELEAR